MKKTFTLFCAMTVSMMVMAQSPFKGTYSNKELNIRARLNLEAKDIPVPGMEDMDSCYGYFQGNLNGSWYILRVKSKDETKAVVRVACDRGDNAEDLEIRQTENGISVKQIKDNYMKGTANRKYVRLPKPFFLTKD